MSVRVAEGDIHLTNLATRMPFKYGIATMTRMPMAFVRLAIEVDGKAAYGISSDLLPPKWFTKDPERNVDDEVHEMLAVIARALEISIGIEGASPFEIWEEIYETQDIWAETEEVPPLLAHFGTSMIERALIDAVCRAHGDSFYRLLHADQLGIKLGNVHAPLLHSSPSDFLPNSPLRSVTVRHTIGLADPLTDADVPDDEKIQDGLPQSLEDCIRTCGLTHFKIKVCGKPEVDRDRLTGIAKLLLANCKDGFKFSLDGNEQFKSFGPFREFWNEVTSLPDLKDFWSNLLFVEQPLHRDAALEADDQPLTDWVDAPPVIIDESDASTGSMPLALKLGYSGTSHKNCKGVFKSIANACLISKLKEDNPGRQYMMSGEDLCNMGPVALPQDLAVCAVLGIESVERNGHHYNAGLSQFPRGLQDQVIHHHGDLFRLSEAGWPTLNIRDGKIPLASVNESAFGVRFLLDTTEFTPASKWEWP
ncbi:MAG: hypothetical protein CMO80_11500 [Verrucomicrobiales bacterium]|nr:hypothetical protein [Verrucomicrobiales bacterium]|tara:strand:- start:779 stop:2212 length:1434 start_codon:yes stop_codon:yes gene_type:complete